MAIDKLKKDTFLKISSEKKNEIKDIDKELSMYRKKMTQNNKLESFYNLGLASLTLKQVNIHIDISYESEKIINIKDNTQLDNAKKKLSNLFVILEKIVTLQVDEPLDFNRELLNKIKPFSPLKRLNLFKHIENSINRLKKGYGENTKWKWSFPDFWRKLAIIGKNFIDFREIQSIRDPREEFFYDRQEMLKLVKDSLFMASNEYRNKFELSTKSNNDLKHAIRLLEDLRRIASLTNDPELTKKAKSGIESYKARVESSDAKKQASKKKKATKKKK